MFNPQHPIKLGVVTYTCDPSTWEVETGEDQQLMVSLLHCKVEASLAQNREKGVQMGSRGSQFPRRNPEKGVDQSSRSEICPNIVDRRDLDIVFR